MTIAITSSGIALDGPLVAGEKVAVTVSGLSLAAEDKPTLALLARFPDALLASVELAEDAQTPGTWTGELDTATKQTALFFATARADERRDAALELVAGRVSLARLTVPMANSALCPKPDGSPFASPVYVPVPGPPGTGGDPYDQAPQMDGEASAGTSDEYARGDHRHPTDESRMAASVTGVDIPAFPGPESPSIEALITNVAQSVPGAGDVTPKMDGTGAAGTSGYYSRADHIHPTDTTRQATISDLAAIRSGAAAGATAVQPSALADVATTGDYGDLLNTPTIPAAQVQSDWNEADNTKADYIKNKPTIPDVSGKADSTSIAPAFSSSSTYAVGDYCTHEGLLYKCTTAVSTAGAWDAANWSAVAVTDEMGADTPLPFDAEVEYIECSNVSTYLDFYVNSLYDLELEVYLPNGTISADTAMLGRWTNSHSHLISAANSKFNVFYGGTSTTSINNAPPTGSWFTMGLQGSVASCNGQTTSVTRKYDTDGASKMMIIATNNARIRRARISYGAHDLMDLRPVRVGSTAYFYDCVRGILVGIDSGTATPGPDKSQPTITTPGRIVELTPALRYAFASPTSTVSGTSATVACEDRSINDFTVATGITSLTITPPAAVSGRARDFFCRVTLTDSSLPTVTLSGGTIDIGATEVAGMTQGVNLLMFTEISSGHWLAIRRSAS